MLHEQTGCHQKDHAEEEDEQDGMKDQRNSNNERSSEEVELMRNMFLVQFTIRPSIEMTLITECLS